jgi:lipid-A-disaccharide synthase-like uncharacterized protein
VTKSSLALLLVLLLGLAPLAAAATAPAGPGAETPAAEAKTADGEWPQWLRSLVKREGSMTTADVVMFCIGMLGQVAFSSRFLVQWIASERRRESYVPVAFWYLSIIGSTMLLAYAISIWALPVILGQCFGTIVYGRNLALIARQRRALEAESPTPGEEPVDPS